MDENVQSVRSPSQPSQSGPASARGGGIARRPKTVERSCILCHRRKIRCDKKSPCATCTRTGVLCCYPASEQPIRRPRKTTIADVAERLVRLERTLVAISSSDSHSAGADTPTESGASSSKDPTGDNASVTEEFLLQNGDTSRYMNEIIISRVLEEEDELRSVLGAQETVRHDLLVDPDDHRFPVMGLNGLLSSHSPSSASSVDLHPAQFQAMQLWHVFVNYVDMFNKLLHIPTTEVAIFTALDDPSAAAADVNCLLFSIYFSAVTAMVDDDVVSLLGYGKRKALSTFRRGLELSLAQADFLEAPTLTSLQAMAIFLQSIRAHNTGRSVWVLCGLVIRAAQSLGVHRDGKTLGLPIFETELRRRLWWCLTSNDGRVAEDHSITINSYDPSINIEFPSNVDDSQLYPGMTELPVTRGRWTEMSLALIVKEYGVARRRLYQVLPPFQTTIPPESVRKEIVDKAKARCEEEYFQYCNTVIPIQRAGMLMGRAVLGKLDFISRLQWLSMANQNTTRGLLSTDETLAEACDILDCDAQIQSDILLRNYRWICEIYPQYHVLLYVLWRLCVQPTGPSVERAWKLVEGSFDVQVARIGFENSPPGSKWTVLKAFREKALKIRQMVAEGKATGNGRGTSSQAAKGDSTPVAQRTDGLAAEGSSTEFTWNPEDDDLPDWNDLVDDLKLDGFEYQI